MLFCRSSRARERDADAGAAVTIVTLWRVLSGTFSATRREPLHDRLLLSALRRTGRFSGARPEIRAFASEIAVVPGVCSRSPARVLVRVRQLGPDSPRPPRVVRVHVRASGTCGWHTQNLLAAFASVMSTTICRRTAPADQGGSRYRPIRGASRMTPSLSSQPSISTSTWFSSAPASRAAAETAPRCGPQHRSRR